MHQCQAERVRTQVGQPAGDQLEGQHADAVEVGRGPDAATARSRAYDAIGRLTWPGMHHRGDIAGS